MINTITDIIFRMFLAFSLLAFPACADSQESNSITYDQIVDSKSSRNLSSEIKVLDSYRISSTEETFYCENHTLSYNLSQNFKNRMRVDQSIEVLFDGKKVEPNIVRQKSNNFDQYKFYDVKYRCINETAGLIVHAYKPGLNGSVSSEKVFSIYFQLNTGSILE